MGFFELLPGRHRVEAGFSGQLYLYSEITSRGSVELEMNAVAGRVYRLVTKPQLVNSALVYHIEDVTNAIWTSDGAPWDHFRKSLIQSYMADRRDSMPAEVMESELAAHEKQLRQSVQARIAENRPYLAVRSGC